MPKDTKNFTPQQIAFIRLYNDPTSETYGNATQSGIKAGFSQSYAENLTTMMPAWLEESVAQRKRMLKKAENKLDKLIDSSDERVAADVSKFIAKTLGKDEGYSERTEHTGKDGEQLVPTPIYGGASVQRHDGDEENIQP